MCDARRDRREMDGLRNQTKDEQAEMSIQHKELKHMA